MATLGTPRILTYSRVRSGSWGPARLALGPLVTVLKQVLHDKGEDKAGQNTQRGHDEHDFDQSFFVLNLSGHVLNILQ